MLSLDEYLKNPCAALSIPFWKAKKISIPNHMKIVHNSVFSSCQLDGYSDERYFRLLRDFENLKPVNLNDYKIVTATQKDFDTIVEVINQSYTDLQVTISQVESYTQTPVYNEELWILVKEKKTDICVGCGIADYDDETKELILEWIQVLPTHRGQKIGQAIVNELLWRAKDYASFATVSGKMDSETCPETLYRKCGFIGNDIWHILHKL